MSRVSARIRERVVQGNPELDNNQFDHRQGGQIRQENHIIDADQAARWRFLPFFPTGRRLEGGRTAQQKRNQALNKSEQVRHISIALIWLIRCFHVLTQLTMFPVVFMFLKANMNIRTAGAMTSASYNCVLGPKKSSCLDGMKKAFFEGEVAGQAYTATVKLEQADDSALIDVTFVILPENPVVWSLIMLATTTVMMAIRILHDYLIAVANMNEIAHAAIRRHREHPPNNPQHLGN